MHASVTATDAAGNATTATDDQAYTVDTVAPVASITLDAITADNIVNAAEAGGDGCGDRHGGRRRAGRRHRHPDGQWQLRLHRPGAGGFTFSIDVAGSDLAADTNVHASVTATDAAGNATTATDDQAYTVDTVAPVASITLDAITADNIVNAAEAGGPRLRSPARWAATSQDGDTITLTVNGVAYTGTSTGGVRSASTLRAAGCWRIRT